MELNANMKTLDQGLCSYILQKDASKKSGSTSVFMDKKQLSTFYGKMYSKANQQIKLQQNRKQKDNDKNKLLQRQQDRIRQKIYSRTFYNNGQNSISKYLQSKQSIKISKKTIITQNNNRQKLIKSKTQCKFLQLANKQLLNTQYINKDKNKNIDKSRKLKSKSYSGLYNKENMLRETINEENNGRYCRNSHNHNWKDNSNNVSVSSNSQFEFDEGVLHRRVQLIQLYQKLYQQFTKQKMKILHSKSKIQGKFSKPFLSLKSNQNQKLYIKATHNPKINLKSSNNKPSLDLHNSNLITKKVLKKI